MVAERGGRCMYWVGVSEWLRMEEGKEGYGPD